jgi:hypothetical protein
MPAALPGRVLLSPDDEDDDLDDDDLLDDEDDLEDEDDEEGEEEGWQVA